MSGGFGGYDVYFAIETLAPWTDSQVWQAGGAPAAGTTVTNAAGGAGFELAFDLTQAPTPGQVEIQVGLSLVSAAEAAANLAAEMPSFAFDATQKATEAAWSARIGRLKFTGGTADQQAMMTAAAYHLFLMPSIQSDVDGSFTGMDGTVHTATGYHYLSDMSLWDTYRTLHPMYSLIAPDRALDSVASLTEKAKESGYFPKWPIATGEAGTMIGASAEIVLADAYLKGVTGFDAEGAYQILRAAAMDTTAPPGGRGGRDQVVPYMMHGYVPSETGDSSVAITTEYANDDFALGALAGALGHTADATALATRAVGYRKLYDPATGLLWSKNEAGGWATSHAAPTVYADEFGEANAWQSAWMVALDWSGLAKTAGREKLIATARADVRAARSRRLRRRSTGRTSSRRAASRSTTGRATSRTSTPPTSSPPSAGPTSRSSGSPGSARAGSPRAPTASPATTTAAPCPRGCSGARSGFYPLAGSDQYVIGAPLFPKAEIAVQGGTFTIVAQGVSDTNLYVQSVTLNGAPLATPFLHHADLKAGGQLSFVMGPAPSTWGQGS